MRRNQKWEIKTKGRFDKRKRDNLSQPVKGQEAGRRGGGGREEGDTTIQTRPRKPMLVLVLVLVLVSPLLIAVE